MKNILALMVLMCASFSYSQEMVQPVRKEFGIVYTCYGLSVSSAPATEMIVAHTAQSGYAVSLGSNLSMVEVQDHDSTNNVFCSDNISVSPQTSSSNLGLEVSAGAPTAVGSDKVFSVVPGEQIYCVNDSTTTSVNVGVCVGR